MPATKRSVFLESRYRKLVRDLPQTIFWCPVCGGRPWERVGCTHCLGRGRIHDDSVQELVGRRLLPAYRARHGKFHGAGREDVDVRMLGRGRPFVYEIVGPRVEDVDLVAVVEKINAQGAGRIEIDRLVSVPRGRVRELKETRSRKRYRIGVSVDGEADLDGLRARIDTVVNVEQRTPERVAHRRGDLVRTRELRVIAVDPGADARAFSIDIETAHGTYVKEWVSGDGGRSTPSISEWLGAAARCEWLDVLEILDGDPAGSAAGT